jgi:biotin-(acetyl-CoA carboxylase) ligase
LAESVWLGAQVESIVLGVGLNVWPEAVPPPDQLNFPATCLAAELPPSEQISVLLDRAVLLQQILQAALYWRSLIATDIFLHAWEQRLAFRGEQVEILVEGQAPRTGQVDGLEPDGSLRLLSPQGKAFTIQFGEVHLRLVV